MMVSIEAYINSKRQKLPEQAIDMANEYKNEFLDPAVPVDTGELKRDIRVDKTNKGASVTTRKAYWKFPEFGNGIQEAQMFVRRSFNAWVNSRK